MEKPEEQPSHLNDASGGPQARFADLLQVLHDGLICVDEAQLITMFNQGAERIFGYRAHEVLGKPLEALLPPRYVEAHHRHIKKFATSPDSVRPMNERGTVAGRRKNGTEFPAEASISRIELDGKTTFAVVMRDISARLRAESARRESEERYHKIFDYSNDAIFIIDPAQDRIVDANPKASNMLGYPRRELISLPVSAIHPDEMPLLQTFADSVFARGHGWTSELTCTTKGGQVLPSEISASTVEVDGRQCIVALVRDISERRKGEEMQRQLAVVAERTRIAREIHDSIAQGLTGIIWQLNAFERSFQGADAGVLESLARVRSIAKDSLRDARRSVWDLRAEFPQGQSLGVTLREELDKVTGDGRISASVEVLGSERVLPSGVETALLRICQESLANMLKYANASEVITVLEYTDTSVRLALEDNGIGFDPGLPVSVDGDKGGFGLISMRERARLLGGELRVESSPGQGTLVEATLPVGNMQPR